MTDIKAVVAELRALHLGGTADIIEQQAKELAEAQARVAVLKDAKRIAGVALQRISEYTHLENPAGELAYMAKDAIETIRDTAQALASTDTAAIDLRAKHYEECAELFHENSIAAKAIRAAIGER